MNKKIEIKICVGTGGIGAGGYDVYKAFEDSLKNHGITAGLQMGCSLHKVGCRGLCAKDVLVDVIINGQKSTYQYIKPDMVEHIVNKHIINNIAVHEWLVSDDYYNFHKKQVKVVLSDCGNIDPEDIKSYLSIGGYRAAKKAILEMKPEDVIREIKRSGLRGRGGAGFPTGIKWELACTAEGNEKYIICNADEGDPGAFMDRSIIEGNPHSVLEGMLIGAYAIGAKKGYVYIRAEYPLAVERIRHAIKEAKENGFIGDNIFNSGFGFDIKIALGAGAFVCGEETALIASIEGQRGMPRAKPPFPVYKGLLGNPTVINNVETLANIPQIINKGPSWFSELGTERSKGTKVFALTGKVKNTGLIEVPFGISLREIIYDIGGGIENNKKIKAVQTGGPSGGCIPADMLDVSVDYESLVQVGAIVGSGGMIVLDEDDCMVNVARYFLQFTQTESCGKCVPCRIGTKRLLEILEKITKGKGRESDLELLLILSEDIKASSLCGLGQTAPNPVISTIKYFKDEYLAHIRGKCPARVCKELLTYSIIEDFCKGCGACLRACPAKAITGDKKRPHKIMPEKCIKCGSCFDVCRFKAVLKE